MDMQIEGGLKLRVDVQLFGAGTGVGDGRPSGLLHNVAGLARDGEIAFSRHGRDFNWQQLTANLGDAETDCQANLIVSDVHVLTKARGTQKFDQARCREADMVALATHSLSR